MSTRCRYRCAMTCLALRDHQYCISGIRGTDACTLFSHVPLTMLFTVLPLEYTLSAFVCPLHHLSSFLPFFLSSFLLTLGILHLRLSYPWHLDLLLRYSCVPSISFQSPVVAPLPCASSAAFTYAIPRPSPVFCILRGLGYQLSRYLFGPL